MDGSAAPAVVGLVIVGGVFVRLVIRADRVDRYRARRPQPARMVPRSPLLAEPRPRRPEPEPRDATPPLIEVPARLFVRAARIAATQSEIDANDLERAMPVIPAMADLLMAALEGRGIVGERDGKGRARVLVTPNDLPGVFERWGIVEDEGPR